MLPLGVKNFKEVKTYSLAVRNENIKQNKYGNMKIYNTSKINKWLDVLFLFPSVHNTLNIHTHGQMAFV